MKELLKTLRLAAYVFALPLVVTAVVSAQRFNDDNNSILIDNSVQDVNVQDGVVEHEMLPISTVSISNLADRHNYVMSIDKDGGITGQVAIADNGQLVGAEGMTVSLNLEGSVVKSARTGSDGVYRLDYVEAGSYTFIAQSETALTAFGVYVDESQVVDAGEVQMEVIAVSKNVEPIREIMNQDVEAVDYDYVVSPSKDELPVVAGGNCVQLTANGDLVGRVVPLHWQESNSTFDMTGNSVHVYQQGSLVSESPVDADGNFVMAGVVPGDYDFVSAGPHGVATFCLEVVGDQISSTEASTYFVSTSTQDGGICNSCEVILSEPVMGPPIMHEEIIIEEEHVGCDTCGGSCGVGACGDCCGGGGGFGGGGGGFGGGFGGIGDLVGLAVGGLVLAEVIDEIDDDDDFDGGVVQPPVVVPPVVVPPVVPPPASPS